MSVRSSTPGAAETPVVATLPIMVDIDDAVVNVVPAVAGATIMAVIAGSMFFTSEAAGATTPSLEISASASFARTLTVRVAVAGAFAVSAGDWSTTLARVTSSFGGPVDAVATPAKAKVAMQQNNTISRLVMETSMGSDFFG